jgi:L-cysteine:1D-myo-inositol 2-amino-2-deoxy-alpha-D-glucopyranoside ligase
MSKSLGNLVFVSALLADGVDPMAIRLAILAHHYREDWDWTDAGLAAAQARLDRWRAAVARVSGPPSQPTPGPSGPRAPLGEAVLAAVRERLADDLDAPGALAVIDAWADTATPVMESSDAALVRDTIDALLGVRL